MTYRNSYQVHSGNIVLMDRQPHQPQMMLPFLSQVKGHSRSEIETTEKHIHCYFTKVGLQLKHILQLF